MRLTLPRRALNRLLIDPVVESHVLSTYSDTVKATLPADDPRTQHVRQVLDLKDGDLLRTGVIDHGLENESTVRWLPAANGSNTEGQQEQQQQLEITFHDPHILTRRTERPRLSLLLALPPPRVLDRILPLVSSLGVDRLYLTNAAKVGKGYFSSHFLHRKAPEAEITNRKLREALRIGLEQAGNSTALPSVTVHRALRELLKELDSTNHGNNTTNAIDCDDATIPPVSSSVASSSGSFSSSLDSHSPRAPLRVLAHPATASKRRRPLPHYHEIDPRGHPRGGMGTEAVRSFTLANVPFPEDKLGRDQKPTMLLAVGPDGGWEDPYELQLLKAHDFQQIHLAGGVGVLKTEVAVGALLTRCHERLESLEGRQGLKEKGTDLPSR